MTKLFIIGNGFDLAHGMKTKYSDFRQFLIDNYLGGEYEPYEFSDVPEVTLMPDGDEQYNEIDVVQSILRSLDDVLGTDWQDVENALSDLNYDYFLGEYDMFNKEDDNYVRNSYNRYSRLSRLLYGAFRQIHDYFKEWISNVKIATIPRDAFKSLINPNEDLFLNFNYTRTLEELYKTKKVCHIHGTLTKKMYFGHGDTECPHDYYGTHWFGAEESLANLYYELMKNTAEAYNNCSVFFKELKELAKTSRLDIYSYGFSFSRVDRYYLEKIFEGIDTQNTCFYMNNYDDKNKCKEFIATLRACGYEGSFDEFSG